MAFDHSKKLSELSDAVRESTLKRLRRVPEGFENWRITSGAMSFADIAQHTIDADYWLFKKLEIRDIGPIKGKAGSIEISDRSQFLKLLEELVQSGKQRTSLISGLSENDLDENIFDSRFGGEVSVWWVIVRGNLDHEIHHRGQIAAYLRAIESQL